MKVSPIGILLGLNKITKFEAFTATLNISKMTHLDSRAFIASMIQVYVVAETLRNPKALGTTIMNTLSMANKLEKLVGTDKPSISQQLFLSILSYSGLSFELLRRSVGCGPFVAESLPFTYAAIMRYGANPRRTLEEIVNQGGDADTNAAVAGAVLGAAKGISAFPYSWRKRLKDKSRIVKMANGLLKL